MGLQRIVGHFLHQCATAYQRAGDTPDEGVEQALELGGRGRRNAMEARTFAFEGVDAVEHEEVDMHIEQQAR